MFAVFDHKSFFMTFLSARSGEMIEFVHLGEVDQNKRAKFESS
jgi:hypothetical protein